MKLPISEELPTQKFVLNPYENKIARYSSLRVVKSQATKTEIELLDARRKIEKLEARVKELQKILLSYTFTSKQQESIDFNSERDEIM